MAAPVGSGNLIITGTPNLNVGSVMKCTEAPTWTGDAPPLVFQYNWKYRSVGGDSSDWVASGWVTIADPTVANLPTFAIVASGLEYQLGIRATDDDGVTSTRYSSPTGPSTQPVSFGGQYVARNSDNTPKDPQPGDTEVTDAFGNVFDNFNTDWVDYDKDNVAINPQPAYQNLNYVSYLVDNTPQSPAWQPDAGQWIARGVDNQVRTPEKYVRSPLYPGTAPVSHVATAFIAVLNVEESEALIVTENDVSEIRLEVNTADYASTAKFK